MKYTDQNGYSWFGDTIDWINDKIIKPAGDFISELVSSYQQTQQMNAELTLTTVQSINEIIDNTADSIINWWNNELIPWIQQTAITVEKTIKEALKAQTDANILSAQMDYHAGRKIADWFFYNRKEIISWSGDIFTTGTIVANVLARYSIIVIASPVALGIDIISGMFVVYSVGDKLGWW